MRKRSLESAKSKFYFNEIRALVLLIQERKTEITEI